MQALIWSQNSLGIDPRRTEHGGAHDIDKTKSSNQIVLRALDISCKYSLVTCNGNCTDHLGGAFAIFATPATNDVC